MISQLLHLWLFLIFSFFILLHHFFNTFNILANVIPFCLHVWFLFFLRIQLITCSFQIKCKVVLSHLQLSSSRQTPLIWPVQTVNIFLSPQTILCFKERNHVLEVVLPQSIYLLKGAFWLDSLSFLFKNPLFASLTSQLSFLALIKNVSLFEKNFLQRFVLLQLKQEIIVDWAFYQIHLTTRLCWHIYLNDSLLIL